MGRVILHVVVEVDGTVSRAELVEGDETFVQAALEAAKHFRFVPAERDGQPVAAKIRVALVFEPPEQPRAAPCSPDGGADVETKSLSAAALSAPPPAPASDARDRDSGRVEVRVMGEPPAPDAESFTRAEARRIPGTFGDPLRAVEALAGVTPAISGLPYFFVRGAPPGNVGYFVDGVRVPMLWHAFVGPSVLNPATIDKVTLHRGGYPARYGRYAGAIVTADTVVPYGDYRGESSLRVVDLGAMQTLPLSEHGRSAVLVAGRYAYLGPIVTSLLSNAKLGYWDYQACARLDLGQSDRLGLLAFGAQDDLGTDALTTWTRFHRIDPRFEHDFSPDSHLRAAVALGFDRTGSDKGEIRDRMIAPRLELHQRFGEELALRAGVDFGYDRYDLETTADLRYRTAAALAELIGSRDETTVGTYADVTWHPLERVWVSPGLRLDVFRADRQTEAGVDPRIAARMEVSRVVAFEHTLGLAHQSATFVPGIPGAQVTNIRDGLQRSVQASSSLELRLPERSFLSATVFDAIYTNLADPLGTEHQLSFDVDQAGRRVRGYAYGLEVFYKRPLTHRVGGMLAYTLSRSTRSYGRIFTLSALDRTHVLTLALVVDAGKNWLLGARQTVLGGLPTRIATTAGPVFRGSERTPVFLRTDLRAEKRYDFGERTSLSIVAELLNATFSHEVTERTCNETRCTQVGVGPIVVPNVGVEARY